MDSANINTAEQNIAQVKTALKAFVENEKIAKMLGKDFVSEMNDWEALIEKKSEEPFTLVILGEFKRGKSTIINALLGKELAPINVTPETYTINEISFGHTQYVEAILENGMRVSLSLEDITREKLEQRMKLFPAKISYVQIKDNAPILKEIRIVDTPGLKKLFDHRHDLLFQHIPTLSGDDEVICVADKMHFRIIRSSGPIQINSLKSGFEHCLQAVKRHVRKSR